MYALRPSHTKLLKGVRRSRKKIDQSEMYPISPLFGRKTSNITLKNSVRMKFLCLTVDQSQVIFHNALEFEKTTPYY